MREKKRTIKTKPNKQLKVMVEFKAITVVAMMTIDGRPAFQLFDSCRNNKFVCVFILSEPSHPRPRTHLSLHTLQNKEST